MDKIPDSLISKFISGRRLSEEEFISIDKLLNNIQYFNQLGSWLERNMQESEPEIVALQFEQMREKIKISPLKSRITRLRIVLSKVAAVLFIPLIAGILYFHFNQPLSAEMLTLSTQKGEQTSVILPDGSKVWLNVDTKLSYPADYGVNSRNLELVGEAYFVVERNEELPFEVTSGNIITKALGTRFVVSAYPECSEIRSSLVSGSVEVEYGETHKLLKPGQQLTFNKNKSLIAIKSFDENYELGWKNDQLVFQFTPFEIVVVELEKWYNIDIEYNTTKFNLDTFTVQFEKYETLERVLQVLAKAGGFKYRIEDGRVEIRE